MKRCNNVTLGKLRKKLSKTAADARRNNGMKGGRPSPGTMIMHVAPDSVVTREAALAMGYTVYRTGKKCKFGHKGWRRTATTRCIDCERIARIKKEILHVETTIVENWRLENA